MLLLREYRFLARSKDGKNEKHSQNGAFSEKRNACKACKASVNSKNHLHATTILKLFKLFFRALSYFSEIKASVGLESSTKILWGDDESYYCVKSNNFCSLFQLLNDVSKSRKFRSLSRAHFCKDARKKASNKETFTIWRGHVRDVCWTRDETVFIIAENEERYVAELQSCLSWSEWSSKQTAVILHICISLVYRTERKFCCTIS